MVKKINKINNHAPLKENEIKEQIKPRDALVKPSELRLSLDSLSSIFTTPQSELQELCNVSLQKGGINPNKNGKYSLNAIFEHAAIGEHRFPPQPELRELKPLAEDEAKALGSVAMTGYLPDHLALRTQPAKLPKAMKAKQRIYKKLDWEKIRDSDRDVHEPTTIFNPDDRSIFSDTAYPWCTVGRVDTPGGVSSGVMIGPRHLLTCSHAIQWNSDGTAGWVKFTPSYFDGSTPFGVSWATRVYFRVKVDGSDGIQRNEGQHDYVCLVLNNRIGDLTGWMGSRSWSDDWDNEPYWRHIGYPGDIASSQRPSYQRDISLDGSFWDRERHTRIWHKGDVWPGQSGGPFFAWWSGESWPSVVAVQSGQSPDENSASGGSEMVDLIISARNEHP